MKPIVFLNPGGGSAGDDSADAIRDALARAGVDADLAEVEGKHLADRAREEQDKGRTRIVAAGGDGTISAVASALVEGPAELGVLPLGTLNHFARDLGIPAKLDEAAQVLASGRQAAVDVAELNGRIFLNNSAIGLYPLMVLDRDAQQKRLGRSKRLAMVVASLRTLAQFHHERLRLTINDSEQELLDTPLLFVGNNDYELSLPAAGCRQSLTDGQLCVMVMRHKGRLGLISAMLRSLVGLTRSDEMIRLDDVQTLRVSGNRSKAIVSSDGETLCLDMPLTYRIRPGALKVVAPASGTKE